MRRNLTLGGQPFQHHSNVGPEVGPDGGIIEDMPQWRYADAQSTRFNSHDHGPFCRLELRGLPETSGVYAVTVEEEVAYVGMSRNLKERWGPRGFARIHPRNCYVGGQSTNCKVNHGILLAAQDALAIDLWVCETANPQPLEQQLIEELSPPWNRKR